MNIVLLIAVTFTLALVHGYNPRPCQKNKDKDAYKNFVEKHILPMDVNLRSDEDWTRYLTKKGLCNRPWQSFIRKTDQGRVEQICNGYGWPLKNSYQGNLCISSSVILVYDINVNIENCGIKSRENTNRRVIVACDKINNRCLPVHFERYTNQMPDTGAKPCSPRA